MEDLSDIHFINLNSGDLKALGGALEGVIDKSIPLPVEEKSSDSPGTFDMKSLNEEQILSALIKIISEWGRRSAGLAWTGSFTLKIKDAPFEGEFKIDKKIIDYYSSLLRALRPNIIKDLGVATVAKARNGEFSMGESLSYALMTLDEKNFAIVLNFALLEDQKADFLRTKDPDAADEADALALLYYKKAMGCEPAIEDAFFNAAFFFLKKHDYKAALDALETYLALVCDISDKDAGERGLYKRTRAQEIVNNIKRDGLTDEDFLVAYKTLDNERSTISEMNSALDRVRQFLQRQPGSARGWFLLGWALRKLNRYTDAKSAFLQSLKCDSDDEELNSNTNNELGLCFMAEGKLNEAKRAFISALKIAPENVRVISNLGVLKEREGDAVGARKYFLAVLEYSPGDAIALDALKRLEGV